MKMKEKKSRIADDVMKLYNEYNEMAEVYMNGDVKIGKKMIKGKFRNQQDASIYLMKIGWLYD